MPNKIDTFWEAFNESRCKTAMLVISAMITFGVVVSEITGNPSLTLQSALVLIIGYWAGRTSKAKDKN